MWMKTIDCQSFILSTRTEVMSFAIAVSTTNIVIPYKWCLLLYLILKVKIKAQQSHQQTTILHVNLILRIINYTFHFQENYNNCRLFLPTSETFLLLFVVAHLLAKDADKNYSIYIFLVHLITYH
jgi:hypothetical protein